MREGQKMHAVPVSDQEWGGYNIPGITGGVFVFGCATA
jgi:hypothetical protein